MAKEWIRVDASRDADHVTVWCCELLRREERKGVLKRWFWMMILATAEIYGGMCSLIYSWNTRMLL